MGQSRVNDISLDISLDWCVAGTPGCGKTLLLKSLAENGNPGSVKKHATSVPTTGNLSFHLVIMMNFAGANIVNIQKVKGADQPPDVVSIREIGGKNKASSNAR